MTTAETMIDVNDTPNVVKLVDISPEAINASDRATVRAKVISVIDSSIDLRNYTDEVCIGFLVSQRRKFNGDYSALIPTIRTSFIGRPGTDAKAFTLTGMADVLLPAVGEVFMTKVAGQPVRIEVKPYVASTTSAEDVISRARKLDTWMDVKLPQGAIDSDEDVKGAYARALQATNSHILKWNHKLTKAGAPTGCFNLVFDVDNNKQFNPAGLRSLKMVQLPSGYHARSFLNLGFIKDMGVCPKCYADYKCTCYMGQAKAKRPRGPTAESHRAALCARLE